jgi:hypothetical protein
LRHGSEMALGLKSSRDKPMAMNFRLELTRERFRS